MKSFLFYFLVILLVGTFSSANAQSDFEKDPVAFGIEIAPIIPSNLFRITATEGSDDNFSMKRSPKSGFKAAALIRFGLKGRFAMQTGIGYIRRHFDIASEIDGEPLKNLRVRAVNYEIPVGASYYVPLAKTFLMSVTLGVAANFLPRDIVTSNEDILQGTVQKSWVTPSFFLNYGFEYRTEKYGFFHLGFSYNIFPLVMYDNEVVYDPSGVNPKSIITPIRGDYFSIMIRYFLPVDGLKNL